MARLVAMYNTPTDKAAFDGYYFNKHVPLAKTVPGLRKYEVSTGPVMGMAGPTDIYLIATLHFDTIAAIGEALGTDAGKATAADLANFAGAGVDIKFFDDRTI
jgi:uncharacterized protein (TIGR02118 family)